MAQRNGTMKRKAILLLSLLSLSSVSLMGISQNPTLVQAEETPATLPDGWNVATLDEGGAPIVTDYLDATAYKDASKGNSLKLYRRQAGGILKAYSTAFVASPNTSYKVEAFLRSDCLDDEENHLILEASEKKTDGSVVNSTIFDMKGRQNGWKNVYGYFQTSTECSTVTLNVYARGYGDFFGNDVSVRGSPAPNYFFNTMFTETTEDQASGLMKLTSSWLSDDAFSGEKSLHLNNAGIKINLGNVPQIMNAKYKLRFRVKNTPNASNRLSVRIDNFNGSTMERGWYAYIVPTGVSHPEWATYEFDFTLSNAKGNCALTWMQFFAYQEWWMDDIEILDEQGFNYFVDGGFEAYDYSGFTYEGMVGCSKSSDGSLAFAGGNSGFGAVSSGSLHFSNEQLGLEIGKTYTLSYESRSGSSAGGVYNGVAYYNNAQITNHGQSHDWEVVTGTFVAAENTDLRLQFSNFTSELSYLRNISVKDEEGVEHAKYSIVEHVSSGDLGENEFPYGNFAFVFPEIPGKSSSSEETFSRETEESISTPAGSESQGTSSQTPAPDASNDQGSNSESKGTSAAVALPIAISILAVSTAGLAISIVLLLRGKKHV